MVKQVAGGGRTLYVCEACGFACDERQWAEKCQAGRQANNSCNIEITEHGFSLEQ
ncbi:MAG: hypothetical protein HYX91_04065 [Chloroflexi bacterium]|nr:hypothetical protein [Chloroflexota bacterium]